MDSASPTLKMPSFLYGTYLELQGRTREEGLRCSEHYRKDASFGLPSQMRTVLPQELVLTQGVSDFQHHSRVWRLYLMSDVLGTVWDALEDHHDMTVRDAFEASFRQTPWGALYFALEQMGPVSAQCTAPRLQAVVRFWEPLASARYLFKLLGESLTLDELMEKSCGWAPAAWCPEAEGPMRERFSLAAERMARATRDDSLAAILRQLPRVIPRARKLQHHATLADPSFQRERLAALDPRDFERVSAACTADLLAQLYAWDRELGRH